MTAAGDARERLRALWAPTLALTLADPDGARLSPHATYKAAPGGDSPATLRDSTQRDATLSGVGTLGRTVADGGTISGRATIVGTSGAGTSGADGPGAGAEGSSLRIPGYEVAGEIGRGGMGVVFRARQRSLARDVAIKLIRGEARQPGTESQFLAEALVNGLLDHPNIVPVHELGSTPTGEVYLAMKLVGGVTWKELLHPGGTGAPAAELDRHLGILQSVGHALAFAHSKGIVHRDLKPENVMVGSFGEVLVMDWGIAVDVRERVEGDVRARHRSTIRAPSGTPAYMPPELAEGRGADIGPWTDTYLLGAILHEILTGAPPHRGSNLIEVLLAASESRPPKFPASAPEGLARICARALEREIPKRFATVAEFQQALADFLRHRSSEQVAEAAARALAEARGSGEPASPAAEPMTGANASGGESARARRYGLFAEAIAGFRQALVLWSENPRAREGVGAARIAYARAALGAGDVVLAQAQLEEHAADRGAGVAEDDEARRLRAELESALASRARARALARRMKTALIAGAVVVVVGLSIGLAVLIAEKANSARLVHATRVERDELAAQKLALEREESILRAIHGRARPELLLLAEGEGGPTTGEALAELFPDLAGAGTPLSWASVTGELLFREGERGDLRIVRPGERGERMRLSSFSAQVTCGALTEDGRFCAFATAERGVRAYSLREAVADDHGSFEAPDAPSALALERDGRRLALAVGNRAWIHELPSGAVSGDAIEAPTAIARLEFRDGDLLVVSRTERGTEVLRCDPRTGALRGRVRVE